MACVAAEDRAWTSVSSGCLLMVAAGSMYAFGVWSDGLTARWPDSVEHKVTRVNLLYEAMLAGAYMPLPGFFFHQFGTRLTLRVGALLMFVSYSAILLQFFSGEPRAPDALSYVIFFFAGHATGYVDAAVIGCNVRLPEADRGAAMGLLKGYFGLSASILTLFYSDGLGPAGFVVLLGPVNAALVLTCSFLIFDEPGGGFQRRLNYGLGVQLAIAFILFLRAVAAPKSGPGALALSLALSVFVVGMMLTTFVAARAHGWLDQCASSVATYRAVEGSDASRIIAEDDEESAEDGQEGGRDHRLPSGNYQAYVSSAGSDATCEPEEVVHSQTLFEALTSINFWLFFTQLLVAMGAGLFVVSNAARIMKAKGGADSINAFVSLVSVSNCAGRIAVGYLAAHPALTSRRIFRPALLVMTLLLMALAHGMFAAMGQSAALCAGFIAGLAYGASWTLDPTILADLCGVANFGQVYGVVGMAPTLGSLLFSNMLASSVYESHTDASDECRGNECYGMAHAVVAALCLGCALGPGLWLSLRTRELYTKSM